jgi:uncharacterized protein (DUF1919 family)
MIEITQATYGGIIHYTAKQKIDIPLKIILKDKNLEGEIYTISHNNLSFIDYSFSLSSVVLPFLKSPYLELTIGSETTNYPFNFDKGPLNNFSIISNSCLGWRTYEKFNASYNSPTISNLILDDLEYLRFCEHNETYLNAEMVFKESKGNINFKNSCGNIRVINPEAKIPNDYPISHHLDVEIHWIHTHPRSQLKFNQGNYHYVESLDHIIPKSTLKEKWIRRANRIKSTEKIFIWSASELFNAHGNWERKQIIDRFKSLPNRSIFLTEREEEAFEDDWHIVKYIPEWEGNTQTERDSSGGMLWNNQLANAGFIHDIITSKFI